MLTTTYAAAVMPSSAMKKCSWRVAGLAESCKQSLLRNRVLNEVDVSIEVEPEWAGPDLPHGHDGGQVSFLAATDQCHGGAATRRFRDTEFSLRH